MSDVIELAKFGVRGGVSERAVQERARDLDAWLKQQPGFVGRTLVGPDAEGFFTDIVRWKSKAEAFAAGERVMKEPCAAAFMALIDPARVHMSHAPVVAELST